MTRASARHIAWPFLIGRSMTCDYRLAAVPAFMAGTAMATALRDGVWGSRSAPGTAWAREIPVPGHSSVTAVYKVANAKAAEYGLPEQELPEAGPLVDALGRTIVVIEGFVIRRSMRNVIATGVAVATLEHVHNLVAPAYRAFWQEEHQFTQQAMGQFEIPTARPPIPGLKIDLPS